MIASAALAPSAGVLAKGLLAPSDEVHARILAPFDWAAASARPPSVVVARTASVRPPSVEVARTRPPSVEVARTMFPPSAEVLGVLFALLGE